MTKPLERLTELGQSVWLDDLTRELLAGPLSELVREDAVRGVTSNPTIFAKAMGGGSDLYDEQMRELVAEGHDVKETFLALAVADVIAACDILRPTGTTGAARTAGSRSRSTRTWPATPPPRSPRPSASTAWWTGPTSTSRCPPRRRAWWPSRRRSPAASRSTSP